MTAQEPTIHDITRPKPALLSKAMLSNAIVSGISGVGIVAGARGLDEWIGLNVWVLVAVGIGLVGFAFDLTIWARSSTWLKRGGMIAVAGDVSWVGGAVGLIVFTSVLTPSGEVALGAITAVVAVFAVVQTIGLRQLAAQGL